MQEDKIVEACRSVISRFLNRPAAEISVTDSFARLGLDSANSVNLLISLEELLDLELEEDLLADHRNIADLAAHLAARTS